MSLTPAAHCTNCCAEVYGDVWMKRMPIVPEWFSRMHWNFDRRCSASVGVRNRNANKTIFFFAAPDFYYGSLCVHVYCSLPGFLSISIRSHAISVLCRGMRDTNDSVDVLPDTLISEQVRLLFTSNVCTHIPFSKELRRINITNRRQNTNCEQIIWYELFPLIYCSPSHTLFTSATIHEIQWERKEFGASIVFGCNCCCDWSSTRFLP